jgi:phosphoribosylformylglycinamidine synthase
VLKVCTDDSPFLFEYEVGGNVIIPIAHGEGRYVCSPETLTELEENDLIAFRYAENPNGSLGDIAGIIGGPDRNVLGMMPHPERAVSEALGSTGGIPFFVSLAGAIQQTLNEVTVG